VSTPASCRCLSPAGRRDKILDATNALFAERGDDDI
jgi:AcrR family transcriptional regulator